MRNMIKNQLIICLTALCLTAPLNALAEGADTAANAGVHPLLFLAVLILAVAAVVFLIIRSVRMKRGFTEKLAAQEKKLEDERLLRGADEMTVALSSLYTALLRVDLSRDEAVCYRVSANMNIGVDEGGRLPYSKWIKDYVKGLISESDRQEFIQFASPENVREGLENETVLAHSCLMRENGAERWVKVSFARISEDDKDMVCMGFCDVDRETRDSLAQKNALTGAFVEAEKASKTNLSFLSRMSHEIRTPMNAIIGLDTLALNDDTLSERSRDYLIKIGESAQHLLGLINDIMDMSRIESGRMKLNNETFSFKAMLDQVNSAISEKCSGRGLSYECHYLSPVDECYSGDEAKLKEVLTNILLNAVRLTDAPGSVTLSVSRTAVFDDKTSLLFSIRDTGVGMDKEDIKKMFEAFSNDDDSRSQYGSTGVSMAIVKSLVEMMDGNINVESEKGVGTEYAVTVTLKNSAEKAAVRDEVIDLNDMFVLVVDDNINSAKYTKSVLDKVGISSDYCTSGADALRMLELQHGKSKPYHLVLMDCNMPEMNGLEATERIKAKYGNEITVVILTGYNWDYIEEDARRVGVDSFLVKPLFPANVIEEFSRIAQRNHITKAKEKGKAELAGRRILLAEDVAVNAEILTDILSMENIEADHAENGRIAVEMFKNSPVGRYSAILMDVRMPEMNGLEATAAIRALDREDAKRIPIIALTANAFDEDIKHSLQAGMNAHLCKPVETEQLFRVMGELILDAQKAEA